MHVLFFIDGLCQGGKERRLVELMKGLKTNPAITFELVVMSQEVHYDEVFDLNVPVHFLIRKSKKDISIFKKLYRLCQKIRPDMIHCWDSMTAVYATPVCKLMQIKLINGMVINTPAKATIFNDQDYRRARLTFPFSDIIIGNSNAGLAAYHAPSKKSICIRNGFNFERISRFEPLSKLKGHLEINTNYIIGMVASFSSYKDYRTFFEAAQILLEKRKDITFLAIGLDTDSAEARKMIQEKYMEHFKLLGKRSEIEPLINLIDIGILSTFTEGISNAILEYMALGKPVIATEGGGTKEIVIDGTTGFLVKSSDALELSDKMNILLNDNLLRSKMGDAGRERIRDHFSIDKMINQYISVYNDLCNN